MRKTLYFFIFFYSIFTQSLCQTQPFEAKGPFNQFSNILQVTEDPNDTSSKSIWVLTKNGLWWSSDYTISQPVWENKSENIPVKSFHKLVLDKAIQNTLYLINSNGSLFKSTNGGNTWNQISTLISFNYRDIESDNLGNLYLLESSKIQKLASTSSTWDDITSAINPTSSEINFHDIKIGKDGTIYIGTGEGKIFKSSNNGDSFQNITPTGFTVDNSSGNIIKLALSPSTSGNSQVIAAICTNNNSFKWGVRSTNAGTSWTRFYIDTNFFQNILPATSLFSIHPTNPLIMVGISQNTAYRTVNGGQNWDYLTDYNSESKPKGTLLKTGRTISFNAISLAHSDFANSTSWTINWTNITGGQGTDITHIQTKNLLNESIYYYKLHDDNLYQYDFGTTNTVTNLGNKDIIFDRDEPDLYIETYKNNANYQINYKGKKSTYIFGTGNGYPGNTLATETKMYNHRYNTFFNYAYHFNLKQAVLYLHSNIQNFNSVDRSTINQGAYNQHRIWTAGKTYNTLYSTSIEYLTFLLHKLSISDLNSVTSNQIYTGNQPLLGKLYLENNDQMIISVKDSILSLSINGGISWTKKSGENTNFNVVKKINDVIINPENYNEVLIATDKGLYYCSNFLSSLATFNLVNGIPLLEVNTLFYRDSDKKVVVGTAGRGIYEGTIFKPSIIPGGIEITYAPEKICLGDKMRVAFIDKRGIQETASYVLDLSNQNGNFTSFTTLDTASVSPFTFNLSALTPHSSQYKLRIRSLSTGTSYNYPHNLQINSSQSLDSNFPAKIVNLTDSTATLQVINSLVDNLYYVLEPNLNKNYASSDIYNTTISGKSLRAGKFSFVHQNSNQLFYNLNSGTEYTVYLTGRESENGCLSPIEKINFKTLGASDECIPISSINSDLKPLNKATIYTSVYWNEVNGFLFEDSPKEPYLHISNKPPRCYINSQYYLKVDGLSATKIKVWVDLNRNGIFEETELLYSKYTNSDFDFILPPTAQIGITKVRIRAFPSSFDYSEVTSCNSVINSQTIDSYIEVFPQSGQSQLYLYTSTNHNYVSRGHIVKINGFNVGFPNSGNTYRIQMSDASGSFSNPVNISTTESYNYIIPSNLPFGQNYRFRLVSSNPVTHGVPTTPVVVGVPCVNLYSRNVNYSGGDQIFQGLKVIDAKRSNLDAKIELKAVQSIELKPGFYANPSKGGTFSATIDGCLN